MENKMNGTEFYELVQDALNKNINLIYCDKHVDCDVLCKLDKRCKKITVTLTEYRRLYMLFKSIGVKVDSLCFINIFVCGDFEMLTEWMKYY